MVLQGVVDHEYLFRDVLVGWPGSVHDARIFAQKSMVITSMIAAGWRMLMI